MVIVLLAAGGAAGLAWFQPWRLVTDTTVADRLSVIPSASAGPASAGAPSAGPASRGPASAAPVSVVPGASAGPGSVESLSAGPVVIREGTFVSQEHETAGVARLVRNGDGTHQLELVGLDTSDGPDLRVWLTDQQVTTGPTGWKVFDDGAHVELGRLKGNRGNQVYPIPAGVQLDDYRSISVWCKRFAVSFGAALLR